MTYFGVGILTISLTFWTVGKSFGLVISKGSKTWMELWRMYKEIHELTYRLSRLFGGLIICYLIDVILYFGVGFFVATEWTSEIIVKSVFCTAIGTTLILAAEASQEVRRLVPLSLLLFFTLFAKV